MMLFLFLSLLIGINIRYAAILGIIEAVLLVGFVLYRYSKKIASISALCLLLGVGLSFIRFDFQKEVYKSIVIEVKDNYYIVSSSFERLYVYEQNHTHEVGDIVSITGKKRELDFVTIESSFDFKEYLNKSKGVYYQLVVYEESTSFSNPIKINYLKKRFLSHFDEQSQGIVKQLLFGMSDDSEVVGLFKEAHLIRIISASGLFLNLIISFVTYLGIRIFKKDKIAELVTFIFLGVYSVFTYPRFVVSKYLLLLIFKWINKYKLKKRFSYIELLSISGILFLLLDYHHAYQTSFLLAYFLPTLIVISNASFKRIKKFKKKILILLISCIAIIPFTLTFYNELSIFSPILQIVLSPFLIIYYILAWISFIGIPIYQGINGFTYVLLQIIKLFSPILVKINGPPFSNLGIFLFEAVYLVILYYLSIGNRDLYSLIGVSFISVSTLYFIPIKSLIVATVSFINVGQGDACLIHKGTTDILIDTGGNIYKDIATECLIPYFKKQRIYDIDLLITTHNDYDHSGAASSLIENFKVKSYIKDYKHFPISIGGISLTNYNIYPNLWKEENDYSLVLYFTIKDNDFLIMGDAPITIEKEIIKDNPSLKCKYLKVGHHGSKTSSSEGFIRQMSPMEAIISCGKNNKYGHPHDQVVSLLKRYKINIRRTDIEGTITYSFMYR